MRRYAAHTVWRSEALPEHMQVVEVDDAHRVTAVYPLCKELPHTEWVKGIILIAPAFPPLERRESLHTYWKRLEHFNRHLMFSELHACRLEEFDVVTQEFTPSTRLVQL